MAPQRPMIIQTQFGDGPQTRGAPHPHGMHRSPSHSNRSNGRRPEHDRSPVRSPGRRLPRAPDAPPAFEYSNSRELVRRRRSISPSVRDVILASSTARQGLGHVEVYDLRDQNMIQISEQDARKSLTTYVAVRLQKRDTSDERDHMGRVVQETWKNAVHRRVLGMGDEEIRQQVMMLNKEEGRVAERKNKLSDPIQTQIETAYSSLDAQEKDRRFQYSLAQFDQRVRKVEVQEPEHGAYSHARNSSKRHRDSSSKSKHKKQKVKQTVSLTVYFRREPKPHTDCRRLLQELSSREHREHSEEDYDEEYFDSDEEEEAYLSDEPSPRTPPLMPQHMDQPHRPMGVPPSQPFAPNQPQPQYAPSGPPPTFQQQPFGPNGPGGPMGQGMNRPMHMGGPPQSQPGPIPHQAPPGQGGGFGQQPNMPQRPFSGGPQNGGPHNAGPHNGPPPPTHPHGGPPNMGPPGGPPPGLQHGPSAEPPRGPVHGPIGGPPPGQPGPPGGFPPPPGPTRGPPTGPARGPPPGAGGRPLGHPGDNRNHNQPFRGANNVTDSPRSSAQESMDREPPWSDGDDNVSTVPSSVDPMSPIRKHAVYEPRDFGIHSRPRRNSPGPYIDDDEGLRKRPSYGRSSRSPPARSPSAPRDRGESHYERKRREGVPAPRLVQGARSQTYSARPRRDDDLSDVEERLERMRFSGNRRDLDSRDHGHRRSPGHSRDRSGRSGRSGTPERRSRGDHSSRGSYEQKYPHRSDSSRERHRRPEGSRWQSPRRDHSDSYGSRHRDVSPRRPEPSQYRDPYYRR